MSTIARFAAYAAAFEEAYASDDWTPVAAFFAEDAVYEIGLPLLGAERCEGRDAILAWFPDILNRFDRRFASRTLSTLEGPIVDGDEVRVRGAATYTAAEGVPDFVLELTETVRFDGDRIVYLEDHYTPAMREEAARFLSAHGERLGLDLRL